MARRKPPTCGVLSGGLDGFIRACPLGFAMWDLIRRPNSGLREEPSRTWWHACATDFGWVNPLSAGRHDALTSNGVIQILLGTLRHRDQRSQSTQGGTMKTVTSRRSLLRNSAATVAALGFGGKLVRAQDAPIRIGVIYDLSGPFAAAGSVPCAIGAQIAIDIVNERGGVAGKYKVQPINADSQSKADAAINEVERLINQEKVEIVLGVYASAHAVPLAAKVEAQKKILWITTAIATSVFKDQNRQYVFRAQIHSDQYGQAFAAFLAENAKAKLALEPKDVKVAIIHEDGPYGVGVAQASEQFAKERGLQIVLREGYSASAPDLSSLVTKLKRAGADVISHCGYNPDITLFLRQAREAGLRFKMLVGNGAGYSQLDKLRTTFGKDVDNFCNID